MTNTKTTIERDVNIPWAGMGKQEKGWAIFLNFSDGTRERVGFYKTKANAEAEAKEFGLEIS